MLIYSPHITSRLLYIANWLGEQTGMHVACTNDRQVFEQEKGICINYSSANIKEQAFWIQPQGLLFENYIKELEIQIEDQNNLPIFFRNESDPGFDFFSAAFFLMSRYEEYLTDERDLYGRYPHTKSIAYRFHFLNRPLIDEWLEVFLKLLAGKFPDVTFQKPSFQFIPTYDIDIAYCYKGKGFFRNLAGCFLRPTEFIRRIQVLLFNQKDPYDAYTYLEQLHQSLPSKAICFLLTAVKRSRQDKNILPHSSEFAKLAQDLSRYTEIGLHPSVFSSEHPAYLMKEKKVLESLVKKSLYESRFHFLKFNLPEDYVRLTEAGITDDYSMGYGTINGFRASTSRSFIWYNLKKEEISNLRIHPFSWMDANSYYEQRFKAKETIEELKKIREKIKSVNGTMITIAHNHFLGTDALLDEWTLHYKNFLQESALL
jgi:hypothetical protein